MDTNHFKEKLEAELSKLEGELKSIGERNPSNPGDWEATAPDMNIPASDPNDVADTIEEYETRSGELKELEIRYNEVKAALLRIAGNTYGVCRISGEPIEPARLEANPAATTCIKHREE
ncbi:MAG TPA: TraR/DksA C4-type zinc finger protein [Candidatus Paceibacterota bacterium]